MRTGSTWLTGLINDITGQTSRFVNTVDEASQILNTAPCSVMKTHKIIDLDWPALPEEVQVVRVLRNHKDSLLSRILYAKNIRREEGFPVEPEITALYEQHGEISDKEFVTFFLAGCPLALHWLAEIAVMERGDNSRCHTITYEELMRDPVECLLKLAPKLWPAWRDPAAKIRQEVRKASRQGLELRNSYLRRQAIGVGGWEHWLTAEQSEWLDDVFLELRNCGKEYPKLRADGVLEQFQSQAPIR